ncbi:MAG: hypothetical protein PHU49_01980 [Syntrophorhabdaceae bacterium]|nr:hypothetical protein [Syntrophorhabdaceae bacterium]MDD5242761.1 hypothetical protein [Syntrophorhabdaceae bacterium]
MANIDEATLAMSGFLKRTLSVEDAKVIKITKIPEGWEGEVEVYEESSFIKSIGLPTKVKDRNIYKIKVDENLDVQSYERMNAKQSQE